MALVSPSIFWQGERPQPREQTKGFSAVQTGVVLDGPHEADVHKRRTFRRAPLSILELGKPTSCSIEQLQLFPLVVVVVVSRGCESYITRAATKLRLEADVRSPQHGQSTSEVLSPPKYRVSCTAHFKFHYAGAF